MSLELAGFIFIVSGMAVLFLTERMSADLVSITGLILLILLGYLTPKEAFSGFSSSVTLTIIPMFMLGAGLRLTGVTDSLGSAVLRHFGKSETASMLVVMVLGIFVSSFMNNVAAVALLLPTAISIAHKTNNSPSRLLIPLSFSILLGGTTTLIGTAPNIVASQILAEQGFQRLHFFDFTIYGLLISAGGIAYMLLIGRKMLPNHVKLLKKGSINLSALYHLKEHVFALQVPKGASIDGENLASLHFGESLGVNVVSIIHAGNKIFNPGPTAEIFAGDTLIVNSSKEDLNELICFRDLKSVDFNYKKSGHVLKEKAFKINEKYNGKTLRDLELLPKYHILAVAIERNEDFLFQNLAFEKLQGDDILHAIISKESDWKGLVTDYSIEELQDPKYDSLHEQIKDSLRVVELPKNSKLSGMTLKQSRMHELTGLIVVGIFRSSETLLVSDSEIKLEAGDKLITSGDPAKLDYLAMLGELELLSHENASKMLESDEVGLMEVVLAPRSQLIQKTVSELSFREKYDMNVIALWRDGKAVLKNLRTTPFKFGDALLLHGLKSKMPIFTKDADFVVLTETVPNSFRKNKSVFAILSILLLIGMSASGIFSLELAAWLSVVVLVLSGAISMDDGYREVDWRVIILVAALLPLSIVFEKMHFAEDLSIFFSTHFANASPFLILFIVGILTSFVSQILEGALAVIFFVPVAISVAQRYGLNIDLAVVFVAVSASNAFLTPFSHRAHLLVMGAGAYKWGDYFKVGLPLTILTQVILFTAMYFSL